MTQDRRPDPDVAALAYEAATNRVEAQRASVDELRSRASTLLGASAIATSFLAGFALDNRTEPLTVFSWLGFISSAALVIFLLMVLRPEEGWVFGHQPDKLISAYYKGEYDGSEGPLSVEETQVALAGHMANWIAQNATMMDRYFRRIRTAVFLIGVMVVTWTLDLIFVTVD